MKLHIHRNQKKTTLSGVHFIVSFRLEVSTDEDQLIRKYGEWNRKLGFVQSVWDGSEATLFRDGRVPMALNPKRDDISFETSNVLNALQVEEAVKSDCIRLKKYVETANSYSGTEEILV